MIIAAYLGKPPPNPGQGSGKVVSFEDCDAGRSGCGPGAGCGVRSRPPVQPVVDCPVSAQVVLELGRGER